MKQQGLNGFWGGFWSVFTATTADDKPQGFWGRLGRFVGKRLNAITEDLFEGAFKISYTPTVSELAILNPIKTALNRWLIDASQPINSLLESGNTIPFLTKFNSVVSQLQLVEEYFTIYQLPNLSKNAQDYLVEQINLMRLSFESTIEELLTGNNISFTKSDATIRKQTSDTIPTLINIPNTLVITGFRYDINDNEIVTISTEVPFSTSTIVAASNTTTTPNSQTNTTFKKIGFITLAVVLLGWAFNSKNKN